MKRMLVGLTAAIAIVMLVAWGTDTGPLMWNAQTGQCNSNVDFAGTTKIGGTTITSTLVGNLTAATNANTASAIVKRDSSGNFSAGTITASLTGNASTATLASTVTAAATTDTECFPALFTDATGSLGAKTDTGLSYNATTHALTATTFVGALTGAASANPTISSGTAAPSSTPAKVGDIYIDTSAHKLYFADMTTDSTGWVIAN